MPEVREILQKALKFYDDHDWIQGQSFSRVYRGPYEGEIITGGCLEGSCMAATGNTVIYSNMVIYSWTYDAFKALAEAAYELFPERFPLALPGAVHKFNDHELTTREDALLVLKHAIRKAEDGHHDRAEPAG